MKKRIHKNQVVITALAVLIAVAGYVTYDRKNDDSKNVAAVAEQKGVTTLSEFFGVALANKLAKKQKADLLLGNNVLAHVPDINDFVEDLNYRKVVLFIGDVDPSNLFSRLEKDNVNHINRFDSVLENNLMFIENCDLQDVDTDHGYEFGNSLMYMITDGYVIYPLRYDKTSKRYFIETNID